MAKADKNVQPKTTTVHVAMSKPMAAQIKTLAQLSRRSLSAQIAWMVEQQLQQLHR